MESGTLKLNSKEIMNKGELYNLISAKKTLSKEDINSSLEDKSKIDPSEFDEFDQEALEGWSESGLHRAEMSNVSRKLGFSGSKLNLILAGVVTIILIVVIFWPFSDSKSAADKQISEKKPKLIEQTDIYIAEKFDTLIEAQKETNIEITALKKTQRAQPKIEKTIEDKMPVFVVDELPMKTLNVNTKNESIKLETRKKIKEIYFHTFKLVDYRTIRSKPTISTQQMDLSGTAANIEKRENEVEGVEWRTVEVPYIDYINKTMYFMDKGRLKNALARFDLILSTYPDDINAQFYAGFALFNLNEFEKAKNRFEQVLQSGISNFDEEAMWYLGLSFEKMGQTRKASDIFIIIADSDSFYAGMAKKKL